MHQVLKNETQNRILLTEVEVARSFWSRGKGLLGRNSLGPQEALVILWSNSIHTCFMKFTIDCVFLDRSMKVKALKPKIKPWRFVSPIWGARHVIEMGEGQISQLKIQLGDQLHVGS